VVRQDQRRAWIGQMALIQAVLEDGLDTAIGDGVDRQGPVGGCFQARWGYCLAQADDAQTRAVAHLRVRLLARMRSTSRAVCGPICCAQWMIREGVHSSVPGGSWHMLGAGGEAALPMAAQVTGDTAVPVEHLDTGGAQADIDLLTDELIGH